MESQRRSNECEQPNGSDKGSMRETGPCSEAYRGGRMSRRTLRGLTLLAICGPSTDNFRSACETTMRRQD